MVEAYVGEYASGKSEMAINRALELKKQGRNVTLVDLDTVEPFYTLRTLKNQLEKKGLKVLAFSREQSFGLGETGAMLNPAARWALWQEGDIIMDVGYGVLGAQTLNLVEGAYDSPELKIMAVVNYSRPMTGNRERIKKYINSLGRVDAIVANTHMGDESTVDLIKEGNREIFAVAAELGIPIFFQALDEKLRDALEESWEIPVKFIKRFMPAAIW
ncbi:MAG: hypothetical protein PHP26_01465 [Syntrophomonas sp.]|uniref:hypothetical protein n=1 Tax=Syntrophomonas sp. TaxID=2053627 RepID=UPI002604F6EE|nr:hypothetical protein [Syntrophomonas sp.]MDD2511198.1 hypothetical protein [Syntrophomonas sp.]MDD3878644.1 hypothetical protein [Syntrophomonas sp.]MDD4627140.1 hypothetical protein [Syntrophomonas sp.]